jgi:hypothetical protein
MPILRSLLPLHNPLGFGAADFFELLLAILLVFLYFSLPAVETWFRRLAERTSLSMILLALLPVALRLALLPYSPVPTPSGSDDFSHLLVADTLAHFRLANPPHPFHQFFEAIYILQDPSYSSMYPPGQGVFLALGRLLFGHPWAGVLLTDAAFCAFCYWMLRAWTSPAWALSGGLLAVFEFGPLSSWMNTYWANAIPALAGCLVFGALPRLFSTGRRRYGLLLGLGLSLHLVTRPFESLLLAAAALLLAAFLPGREAWRTDWRKFAHGLIPVPLVLLPAIALLFFQNKAVTGDWTTLPYVLSRYQYGIPATFVFQPNPTPHRQMTPEQDLDYRAQSAIHGDEPETIKSFLDRLAYRVRYYRFFILPPLYLALLAFLVTLRQRRDLGVVLAALIFALASNLYPYFYPHYIGAAACLFVLMSVLGLSRLEHRFQQAHLGRLLLVLSTALFLGWYGLSLRGIAYDDWNSLNRGDPEGRIAINNELARSPGQQLVFVHYSPQHRFHEWIHNDADIDAARVVWALDLGEEEDEKLIRYYPARRVWLVEPDAQPARLRPYR